MKKSLSIISKSIRLALFAVLLYSAPVQAQQVPRQALVEQFTNSWCSVCANLNPGFYTNLRNFPDYLHVSYFPSSPYPGCPINQYNTMGNDARTNYYGVFGSTPRLVVHGAAIPPQGSYSNAALLMNGQQATSAFSISILGWKHAGDSIRVMAVIRKEDSSPITTANLYGFITQDTLRFAARNGEPIHYNVFRTSLNGNAVSAISLPSAVGDFVNVTYTVPANANWGKTSATLVLSDVNTKAVVQAARAKVTATMPTAIDEFVPKRQIVVYPNPATAGFNLELRSKVMAYVFSSKGDIVFKGIVDGETYIKTNNWASGTYNIVADGYNNQSVVVTK